MSLNSARIILFPESTQDSLKIVNLPHPRTNQEYHYALVNNEELYELTEFDNDNPHSKTNHLRSLTKTDGKPVRSLLLENVNDESDGLVLEESNIIISTKFNFTYILITYFILQLEQGKEFRRYQSLEDITDVLEESIPIILQLPGSLLNTSLENICDSINENDEKFYKFSEEKTINYLKTKSELISQNFPKSIESTIVSPLLYPANIDEKIPEDIKKLALIKYSIHLISSYLHPKTESRLNSSYNFESVNEYITKIQKEKLQKKAAEDQIQNLNQINAQNKRSIGVQDNKNRKKPTPAKKIPSKVIKGPLDGFFGKKK
ncbi:Ribonuclease H2 subunit B [Wickerhamomyces ciferrii]|uniref:Ribonuclease H2 subunit B n=1 Tax=Wickerhamomyces ciferrii (strain ATCC 14091 / BCRC 22168 / CBS 111 / JCM 3599 / NBRC 0793 / NRRL Y-1031 F-60-10) TaxID=1206466 RepID=K0KPE8_WICCF|nr:Ribonuclease H2 subunit B [Wickerhamomyces ciferrii]CCH44057.1 Ribonuclease H2 subunit B [Wickerhamomyces ciferrii]